MSDSSQSVTPSNTGSGPESSAVVHVGNDHGSVVIDHGGGATPRILYWGPALGPEPINPLMFERPVVGGGLDVDPPVGLVAEPGSGWFGRPGVEGHRPDGSDFSPRFVVEGWESAPTTYTARLVDDRAQLALTLTVRITPSGVLTVDAELTNRGREPYHLSALRCALPVGFDAGEVLTLVGRHLYEFAPRRTPWNGTGITVENRHGKTSHERLGAVFAGTPGFGEHHGRVWGVHIGWSGNYELVCDAVTDGRRIIQAGELLAPGEVRLEPGERYAMPTVYGAFSGHGLNAVSSRFHAFLRSRAGHPRLPRPVHLNTWEAVYFDHDLDTLKALADAAAEVGVERFVLDDGWFGSRRDDTKGLGDWWVSAEVWPRGLGPIVDHVRSRDMEFGIWLEPEMVNPDSDLSRNHPEWALVDRRYPPVLGRNQLVLDLGRAEVRDYLFDHIDALLRAYEIAYIKWDHNRDLVAPTTIGGRAGTHTQTLGAYELIDRIKAAHPGLEIETCASGGGRVDFGILDRTDRVWTSDSIDALDRQSIQRGFSLLFPPELMGAHIGPPTAHTTGRTHRLDFRAAAAVFGALGIEWNLLSLSPDERRAVASAVAWHKRHRPLLHTGTVYRADHPDPTMSIHGVVAPDGDEALVSITRVASGISHHSAPVVVPGLRPDRRFEVRVDNPVAGAALGKARRQPAWLETGLVATGHQLSVTGFHAPQLDPETTVVVHIVAI